MKKISVISFCLFVMMGCAVQQPKTSKEFNEARRSHQRVAILPFDVSFSEGYQQQLASQNKKARTENYWFDLQDFAGRDMQKDLFTIMAKQIQKGKYELAIQDFQTTDKALSDYKISYDQIKTMDKGQLAKKLGVDAVLWGTSEVTVNTSGGFSFSPMGGVETTLRLYDARTSEMLWEYGVNQRPGNPRDTPNSLAASTVSQIARRLPYLATSQKR